MSAVDDIRAAAEKVKTEGKSKPRVGRHPVNQPMVDHWLDAIGDRNPIYVDEQAAKAAGHPGIVAPPAMVQVWTMMGLGGVRPDDDPLSKILGLFDEAGYIGVVATNCEQTYHRYLRPGEEVSVAAELTDVVGPKRTALGEGFFITQKITWQVGDEDVAEMMWRIMKFKPTASDAGDRVPHDLDADSMMRPASSRDTKFFWDGVNAHELRIQKRPDGSLQHPPVPAVWQDKDTAIDYQVVSARARCSPSSCTTPRRCPAGRCHSSSRSSNSKRGCGCWVSCATWTPPGWRSECQFAQRISTFPTATRVRRGLSTRGSRTHERG